MISGPKPGPKEGVTGFYLGSEHSALHGGICFFSWSHLQLEINHLAHFLERSQGRLTVKSQTPRGGTKPSPRFQTTLGHSKVT